MTLHPDCHALEALPLRLLIIAVVACLSVVPASDALESLKDKAFLQRCETQLEMAIRTSQMISMEGYGAARTLQLDFRSEGDLRMRSVTMGGGWGEPCMSSAILELSSGGKLIRTALEPAVWMATEDGTGLTMRAEMFVLRLTSASVEQGPMVLCEAMPWTS